MSKILVIGDVMLDKYSYGLVRRLNPEWPSQLLNVDREEYRLWWAANVAANISSLNGEVELIGTIGKDDHGKKFTSLCQEKYVHLTPVILWIPTITKQRFIETTYQQQLLRVDYEERCVLSHQDNELVFSLLQDSNPQYIIFSDYNKWMINKELVDWVKYYAQKHDVKIFVDTKPSNLYLFDGVYLIKPNLKEFRQMIGYEELPNTDDAIKEYGLQFVAQYQVNLVITRWNKWAALVTKDGEFYSLPTKVKQVFDVTWAWDTFLAAIVYALAHGQDLKSAVELGNRASGIVVGKLGTSTVTPEELDI